MGDDQDSTAVLGALDRVAGLVALDDDEQVRFLQDTAFRAAVLAAVRARLDLERLRTPSLAKDLREAPREEALGTLERFRATPTSIAGIEALIRKRAERQIRRFDQDV
jgi:hypothetical protein